MDTDSLPAEDPEPLQQFFLTISDFLQHLTPEVLFAIALVVCLLMLSALISGSEVAYFSMSPKDMEELNESTDVKDKRILNLLKKPRLLLATILVSNNFVNIAIIIVSNFIISVLFPTENPLFQILLNVIIVTSFLVFFGEVAPKVFANQSKLVLARFTSKILRFFRVIFYPISWPLWFSGLFIEKRISKKSQEIDLDEIEKAIELSTTSGASQEDVDMLKGIVHFGNTTVKQIMKSRVDIIGLEISQPFNEVLEEIKTSGYSRMPVYKETIDKIEGILYTKDLIKYLDKSAKFKWQDLIREPMYVPETKKIDDLLREIQENRKHQSIVVDEYGGTSGLVTLEDILEEIVGDIKDEFDDDLEQEFRKIDDSNYIFEGKIMLNDVCRILEIENNTFDLAKGESDTLAGLLLEIMGVIPKKGAKSSFKNYEFTVLALEKNRIDRVKLTIKDDE